MIGLIRRLLPSRDEREVRRYMQKVERINALEPEMERLSDAELRAKTDEFRRRLEGGQTLDDLLIEAFAVVREASKRTLGLRHFDVQLVGGMVLHDGRIAEMKTGEGKTLVATLPAYLNALLGKGVHVVTVNDYLAARDRRDMGRIYEFLGLTVGLNVPGMSHAEKQAAYQADITYGTNNEFGFDYLRDNMALTKEQIVQRPLYYAIIDEVDSILIDEARTPLIISGMAKKDSGLYYAVDRFVRGLQADEDYTVDRKAHSVALTERGVAKAERYFGIDNLYDPAHMDLNHHILQALKAHVLMRRDVDYVVEDGQVIIVDEFTGRLMYGRRYSDGLHQAIEAKEGLRVQEETMTLATITLQNYFRLYQKLAGMTGTAKTEEEEFKSIYGMDVVVIPTHKPMIRVDAPDVVFKTAEAKFYAVVEEIVRRHLTGQPVLVGTVSIEVSEHLSEMLRDVRRYLPRVEKRGRALLELLADDGRPEWAELKKRLARPAAVRPEDLEPYEARLGELKGAAREAFEAFRTAVVTAEAIRRGIPHEVLNAKHHAREAEIVARAGERGAVTIATNMAGRGTDIKLGPGVAELGGLAIIGTERHEARRIDNQLRGRAGRQGDPGHSQFFLSLEDELMQKIGGEQVKQLMERFRFPDDEPIESPLVTRAIESAQKRMEALNFDRRRIVLQYDNVLNEQREIIYKQRREVLFSDDVKPIVLGMIESHIRRLVEAHLTDDLVPEEWDLPALVAALNASVFEEGDVESEALRGLDREAILSRLVERARVRYEEREAAITPEVMREFEKVVLLRVVDAKWMDHIDAMDQLRQGIHLRAYAQTDPLREYQFEGFEMFKQMIASIEEEVTTYMMKAQVGAGSVVRVAVAEAQAAGAEGVRPRSGGADAVRQSPGAVEAVKPPVGTLDGPSPRSPVGLNGGDEKKKKPIVKGPKIGRNDPCPCGSGKKYKHCHGKNV
ncbi:MAG: preprotein translocase subunit SecA [Hydrogenibacillus schlegelii]|nr:preprotein translocase subunit SecA [Hydrogenibacillus schlegelii]